MYVLVLEEEHASYLPEQQGEKSDSVRSLEVETVSRKSRLISNTLSTNLMKREGACLRHGGARGEALLERLPDIGRELVPLYAREPHRH